MSPSVGRGMAEVPDADTIQNPSPSLGRNVAGHRSVITEWAAMS